MNKLSIILAVLLLQGCSGSNGGGVTNAPTSNPDSSSSSNSSNSSSSSTSSSVQSISLTNSSIIIKDTQGIIYQGYAPLSLPFNLIFTAKDSNGNPISGLAPTISVQGLSSGPFPTTESPAGVYTANLTINQQGFFTAIANINGSPLYGVSNVFSISYCQNAADPSQVPFHALINSGGTSYYLICSTSELVAISQNQNYWHNNYLLGNSIDLGQYYSYDPSNLTVPLNQFSIGSATVPFTGQFNGSGYSISNFVNQQSTGQVGLFNVVGDGAVISNLIINNFNIKGLNEVGVIGVVNNSANKAVTINNISVYNSTFNASTGQVGNLIGSINALGSVSVTNNTVSAQYNLSSLPGPLSQIGGLVGANSGGSLNNNSIYFNLSYTDFSGNIDQVGGLVGSDSGVNNSTLSGNTINSVITLNKGSNVGCLVGKSSGSNISNLSVSSCQVVETGGSSNSITLVGGLVGQANNTTFTNIASSITGINIVNSFGGLASQATNCDLTQIELDGSISSSGSNFGGIVGESINNSYNKIANSTDLVTTGSPNSIGGIIGTSSGDILKEVHSSGTLDASSGGNTVGGLIGYVTNSLSLSNAYTSSYIKGTYFVGGLVGQIFPSLNQTVSIANSYVSAHIGGNSFVGGLVGDLEAASNIANSFMTGSISDLNSNPLSSSVGIVTAINGNAQTVVTNFYYLSEANNTTILCGGPTPCTGTDKTTNLGQSLDAQYFYYLTNTPMNNWDVSIWYNLNGTNYPVFQIF